MNYKKAIKQAKELPIHTNGELQNHYKYTNGKRPFQAKMYANEATPVSVFEALNPRYNGAERLYIQTVPTYRENGDLKKKSEWDKKLMYHKAWARKDVEVTDVNFDIVGIKRQTTHLPAGVLISNVEFKIK